MTGTAMTKAMRKGNEYRVIAKLASRRDNLRQWCILDGSNGLVAICDTTLWNNEGVALDPTTEWKRFRHQLQRHTNAANSTFLVRIVTTRIVTTVGTGILGNNPRPPPPSEASQGNGHRQAVAHLAPRHSQGRHGIVEGQWKGLQPPPPPPGAILNTPIAQPVEPSDQGRAKKRRAVTISIPKRQ